MNSNDFKYHIGILTMNGYNNYGNILQNYALQNILKNLKICCNTIWFDKKNYGGLVKPHLTFKEKIKFIINYNNYRNRIFREIPIEYVKNYNLKKFCDKYISYDFIEDYSFLDKYDFFIVGSDQVWNPFFWKNKTFYSKFMLLSFVEPHKRIAYAASFGISYLPNRFKTLFKKNLSCFNKISVREKDASEIVEKLNGYKPPVVLDPTLLVPAEDWRKIEIEPEWLNTDRYILTYFLGKMPSSVINYANNKNLKIINLMDYNNVSVYSTRVEEFLYLLDHASFIFTDSFHGTVFSIIFNKKFITFDRISKKCPNMTSRLSTLFSTLGIKQDIVNNDNSSFEFDSFCKIDYENVRIKLETERMKSIDFLKNSIFSSL